MALAHFDFLSYLCTAFPECRYLSARIDPRKGGVLITEQGNYFLYRGLEKAWRRGIPGHTPFFTLFTLFNFICFFNIMKRKNGHLVGRLASPDYGTTLAFRKDGSVQSAIIKAKDPKTLGQTYQRLKMPNLGSLHKAAKVALEKAFQGMVPNVFTELVRYNATLAREAAIGLTKEQKAEGAGVVFPYMVSQGTLPAISVNNHVSDIKLQGLSKIDASTTIGAFADAVVKGNPGRFHYDDRLTFIQFHQGMMGEMPLITVGYKAVTLAQDSTELMGDNLNGFAVIAGQLGVLGQPAMGGYVWIHSRINPVTELLELSTQSIISTNDAFIARFQTPEKLREAAISYSANMADPAVLEPTTSKARRINRAFGISDSNQTSQIAGDWNGIMYLEYNGRKFFPGERGPEIMQDIAPEVKVVVSDGSVLGTVLQAKINGESSTNPVRNGNEITLTIPASVDGDIMTVVTVMDVNHTWKIEL